LENSLPVHGRRLITTGFASLYGCVLFYKVIMGKKLNLKNPQTFNEKLQWLKLNNRRPEYIRMVDKYEVRKYIADMIGEKYLIPLLGVWNNPDEIDFDELPNQFALKCNHNSGLGMCICKDKSKLNIKAVKKELWKGLKQDYYLTGREWPYKDVPRKIIAEKYLGNDLTDYRFYCFNGTPRLVYVYQNKSDTGLKKPEPAFCDIFDMLWNLMPYHQKSINSNKEICKPNNFDYMLYFAKKLSGGIPFLRVDYYEVDERLLIGELTLFPGSGMASFTPTEWDRTLGDWIELPKENS
jgi:hypothetical protein